MERPMSVTESYLNEGYLKARKEDLENVTQGLMEELHLSKDQAQKMAKKLLRFPYDEKPPED